MAQMAEGRRLATDIRDATAQKAEGFCTPRQDRLPQVAHFLPRRVLPVIFLPGIMGSNLKITDAQRQKELRQKDNIAWRPDLLDKNNLGRVYQDSQSPLRDRQLRLDPLTTDVDEYDPKGPADVSGDGRNSNVSLPEGFDSPPLRDDPPTQPEGRTAVQKARMRGWGEVFYKSYGPLLQMLEMRLNNVFVEGKARPEWADVVGVDPARWMPAKGQTPQPVTEDDLKKATAGCFFPVHAIGYNWLRSNEDNALERVVPKIRTIMEDYRKAKFECHQVILVTHSMGGLLARAVCHPSIGNLEADVLGVVHGVQPAIGAAAAYKRMRAGFEDPGLVSSDPVASITAKVLGNYGDEVTAVLANAPGGLELLPTRDYGPGWLRVTHRDYPLLSLPKEGGDPYEEIYKVRGKWYSLLREEWINPADKQPEDAGWSVSMKLLAEAQAFHAKIAGYYHPNSYAHYGADAARKAFGGVHWRIGHNCVNTTGWQDWPITGDSRQGALELLRWQEGAATNRAFKTPSNPAVVPRPIAAALAPPDEAGDQTVPVRSADDQLNSGRFKAVFRQSGYEHQASYKDEHALASTLYSVVRIALGAKWRDC